MWTYRPDWKSEDSFGGQVSHLLETLSQKEATLRELVEKRGCVARIVCVGHFDANPVLLIGAHEIQMMAHLRLGLDCDFYVDG